MKILWVVLGILNLLACGLLAFYYSVWLLESASDAFTWGLPILIAAIVALIGGIAVLKWKELGCAVAGLIIVGIAGIYLLILAWFGSWTMA